MCIIAADVICQLIENMALSWYYYELLYTGTHNMSYINTCNQSCPITQCLLESDIILYRNMLNKICNCEGKIWRTLLKIVDIFLIIWPMVILEKLFGQSIQQAHLVCLVWHYTLISNRDVVWLIHSGLACGGYNFLGKIETYLDHLS